MFRFIVPIILIGITVTGFFMFTNPLYNDISSLRVQVASYNEALNNSKALENERDKLTKKYNSIDPENLDKLQKLLPDNVDNIRLILEIEKIGAPYGMLLKEVKYSSENKDTATTGAPVVGGAVVAAQPLNKDYGTWDLEFSTTSTYSNFLNFIRDLEDNLRIVDIASIDFSSNPTVSPGSGSPLPEIYKYSFKIKTYWLKN